MNKILETEFLVYICINKKYPRSKIRGYFYIVRFSKKLKTRWRDKPSLKGNTKYLDYERI